MFQNVQNIAKKAIKDNTNCKLLRILEFSKHNTHLFMLLTNSDKIVL